MRALASKAYHGEFHPWLVSNDERRDDPVADERDDEASVSIVIQRRQLDSAPHGDWCDAWQPYKGDGVRAAREKLQSLRRADAQRNCPGAGHEFRMVRVTVEVISEEEGHD